MRCGFTWFILMQLFAGAFSASHLRTPNAHRHVRSGGKRQREKVDNDHADDAALAMAQVVSDSGSRHPKKSELMAQAAPTRAKNQKATASKKAAVSKSKKGTASKEIAAELDETVADAQDTLASAEGKETSEDTHEVEKADEIQEFQGMEETEGTVEEVEMAEDVEAAKAKDVETKTETEEAVQSEEADTKEADKGARRKATKVVAQKETKATNTKKIADEKAGHTKNTPHTESAEPQLAQAHGEEHEDLPKLKAWAMVGRLFRRLHASLIAVQGGSSEEVALIAQAPEEDQPSTGQVFSSLLLWSCLSCLVAYFYSNRKEKPGSVDAEKQNEGVEVFQEWKHGLFSCHEDTEITLCACCCPAIRWAMTLSYVPGLLSFWVAFFIYVCVEMLGGLTAGTIGWVCLALLCTAYRQELRQKFNMEQQGGMTYITDAMTYLCCTCCAIAQEARHVEDALKSGHPALQESEEKCEAGQ